MTATAPQVLNGWNTILHTSNGVTAERNSEYTNWEIQALGVKDYDAVVQIVEKFFAEVPYHPIFGTKFNDLQLQNTDRGFRVSRQGIVFCYVITEVKA